MLRRLAFRVRLWFGAALCVVCACGTESPKRHPNIIWIVWDTVRADHMSLYGYPKPTPLLKNSKVVLTE